MSDLCLGQSSPQSTCMGITSHRQKLARSFPTHPPPTMGPPTPPHHLQDSRAGETLVLQEGGQLLDLPLCPGCSWHGFLMFSGLCVTAVPLLTAPKPAWGSRSLMLLTMSEFQVAGGP